MPSLEFLRSEIDDVDRQLVPLLEKRLKLSVKIGLYKREAGLSVSDPGREAVIRQRNVSLLNDKGFTESISNLYQAIFEESRRLQKPEGDQKHA